MYSVISSTAWAIVDAAGNIVLEVTSQNYAEYLCMKLNTGKRTLADIENLKGPDMEYFAELRQQYTEGDI